MSCIYQKCDMYIEIQPPIPSMSSSPGSRRKTYIRPYLSHPSSSTNLHQQRLKFIYRNVGEGILVPPEPNILQPGLEHVGYHRFRSLSMFAPLLWRHFIHLHFVSLRRGILPPALAGEHGSGTSRAEPPGPTYRPTLPPSGGGTDTPWRLFNIVLLMEIQRIENGRDQEIKTQR
jgi:hypothetical protein